MTVLSRGANAALTTASVQVAVSGARQGSVDLMVFQLGADHRVRSDADFVFFNQPASPEGAVRLVAADRITADLTAVPTSIQTLAIAVALDDSVAGSLAAIAGLGVTITGGHDAPAAGLTTERAAVLVEIYRRDGAWKVRNVSAGWAAGLSALAGEHGVSVDDEPEPLPSPVLTPAYPAAAGNAPQSYPPSPNYPPAQNVPSQNVPTQNVPIQNVPAPNYPSPGGYQPPGGTLPPPAPFNPPTPGGWAAPGGDLR